MGIYFRSAWILPCHELKIFCYAGISSEFSSERDNPFYILCIPSPRKLVEIFACKSPTRSHQIAARMHQYHCREIQVGIEVGCNVLTRSQSLAEWGRREIYRNFH